MKLPFIPAQAVRNFCLQLGLSPSWNNIKICWHLLLLAKMDTADAAAFIQLEENKQTNKK